MHFFSTSPSSSSASPLPLAAYGWDADREAEFAPHAERGLLPGRVVRVDRGLCDVVTAAGIVRADTEFVVPRDPLKVVCTGDWVAVDPEDADPRYVQTLLTRRTAFVRSTSSKRSEGQILAANVDHAVVAMSLAVELDLGRIERFLALAWESGAQPVVVLTKADLVPDPVALSYLVEDVEASAPGVPVLTVCARDGDGVEELAALLGRGTSVLLGASGAGKSTLANALVGEDVMGVQATRDMDGKGRHTTTTRNLLPLPGGGVLIDTPGLRGVGLWDSRHRGRAGLRGDRGVRPGLPVPRLRARVRTGVRGAGGRRGRATADATAGELPQARPGEPVDRRQVRRPRACRRPPGLEAQAGHAAGPRERRSEGAGRGDPLRRGNT